MTQARLDSTRSTRKEVAVTDDDDDNGGNGWLALDLPYYYISRSRVYRYTRRTCTCIHPINSPCASLQKF